ncbi:WXG100 family type VII secretion target [Nocardia sp. SSK8]|uniref:WXG100 family type VII secretion target n=1 Tax=Nocardia sp. SSK8 TaxID=3120154 RepID=UPI00300AB05E
MAGTENARIGSPEKPDTWAHWAIYRAFNPLETTEANNARSEYQKLASDWSAAVETFAARIRRSSTSAWEGAAATASQNAIADYATRALELTPALNALAQQVTTTVTGVDNTRLNVDEPENSTSNPFNIDSWFGGKRSLSSIEDARDKAREAMQNYYVTSFTAADQQIPVLPHPESPTSPLTSWKPTGGDTGDNGDGNGGGNNTNPAGTNGQPTTEDPATTEEPTTTEEPDTDDPGNDETNPSTTEEPESPDSTTPATTPDTTPAGTTPAGSPSPGSPGSPSGGSPGGGSPGGAGTPNAGTPGAAVPGSPAGVAKVPAGVTATAAGAAGRAGAAGMGGMGGGRGGGKSEDDETHQIPDWLKTMENTEELLGEMPRTINGGVIGGDFNE